MFPFLSKPLQHPRQTTLLVWSALLFLLLGTASSLWFIVGSSQQDSQKNLYTLSDYMIEGAEIISTNDLGLCEYRLLSKKIVYQNNPEGAAIEYPDLTIYQKGVPSWQLTAQRGWMDRPGKWIRLENEIYAKQLIDPTTPSFPNESTTLFHPQNLSFNTSFLLIYPKQKLILTPHEVVIESDRGSQLTTQGIVIELDRSVITLLRQVRGKLIGY